MLAINSRTLSQKQHERTLVIVFETTHLKKICNRQTWIISPRKYPGENSKNKYLMLHHLLGIGILQEVQVTSWNLCFHCHAPNVWHFHSTNRKVKGFKLESLQGKIHRTLTWHLSCIFTATFKKNSEKHYQLNWNCESVYSFKRCFFLASNLPSQFFSSRMAPCTFWLTLCPVDMKFDLDKHPFLPPGCNWCLYWNPKQVIFFRSMLICRGVNLQKPLRIP